MKFNEFKNPQLTEEQIVLAYCKGEITKEDAVSQLSEADWRDIANNLTWGAIDSRAEQDAQDAAGYSLSDRFAMPGPAAQAVKAKRAAAAKRGINSASDALASAPGASPASAIQNLTGLDFSSNAANAATPPTQYADDPSDGDSGMNTPAPTQYADDPSAGDSGMNTTPAPTPAPAPRQKVKATAANTRDYDKTLALQKKLIAQGANIKADGLMGPNTRAAMKAFKNTNPATGGMGPGGAGGVANPKPKAAGTGKNTNPATGGMGPGGAGGVAKPKPKATGTGMKSTTTPGSKVKTPGPSVTQNPAYKQTGMNDVDMPEPEKKKMPRGFGLDFMPRVDDPKGGEEVKTPFGSYKTLPKKDDDFSDRS